MATREARRAHQASTVPRRILVRLFREEPIWAHLTISQGIISVFQEQQQPAQPPRQRQLSRLRLRLRRLALPAHLQHSRLPLRLRRRRRLPLLPGLPPALAHLVRSRHLISLQSFIPAGIWEILSTQRRMKVPGTMLPSWLLRSLLCKRQDSRVFAFQVSCLSCYKRFSLDIDEMQLPTHTTSLEARRTGLSIRLGWSESLK